MIPTITLNDLCDPRRGITYGIVKVGTFIADGVPVVRGGDIRNGRISFDNSKRVSHEISEQFRRTILRGGEILVNLIGEAGHSAVVPGSLAGSNVSRDVAVIAIGERGDARFVDYCLKSPQAISWLHSRLQGSVTQKINLSTLKALPIPSLPLNEQKAIASVLGALDDKVALNRQISATLDVMARALFKSWFVDFDPVRAKTMGHDTGLPPEIAALFPDSLTDGCAHPFPAGWSMRGLDDVASFLNGLALQKFPPIYGAPNLPVIKISQLRAGHSIGADRAAADLRPDYVVTNGDILFSWSGSLECNIWTGGPGALNQHLFKVRGREVPDWFAYLAVREHLPEFRQIATDKATTMGHIQRHHLHDAKVAVPSERLLQAATSMIGTTFEASWKSRLECVTLTALRDALLPKLISGEVRVKTRDA